jgi:hypothetical protein
MTKKESNIFWISFFVLCIIDYFIERYLEVTISSIVLAAVGIVPLYFLLKRYGVFVNILWKIIGIISQVIFTCWVLILYLNHVFITIDYDSLGFSLFSLFVIILYIFTNIVNLTLLVNKKARLKEAQQDKIK